MCDNRHSVVDHHRHHNLVSIEFSEAMAQTAAVMLVLGLGLVAQVLVNITGQLFVKLKDGQHI